MKPIIIGTSFIGDTAQKYEMRVVELWAKLAKHLNPGVPKLMIDSASPNDPTDTLERYEVEVFRFPNNVGHLNYNGKDGFGRAFCKGIEIANERNYSHVAYMDADIISTLPVMPIFQKMINSAVVVACPLDTTYFFIENGLMFYDVNYMIESEFIERYDWENRKRTMDPQAIPEVVFEKLLGDDLFLLPIRGLRDDFNRLTVNNVTTAFPYGLDYLTHCRDFRVYERFIESKGIKL